VSEPADPDTIEIPRKKVQEWIEEVREIRRSLSKGTKSGS
jgi:hypothetical protein